jgi:hypothetical protein
MNKNVTMTLAAISAIAVMIAAAQYLGIVSQSAYAQVKHNLSGQKVTGQNLTGQASPGFVGKERYCHERRQGPINPVINNQHRA